MKEKRMWLGYEIETAPGVVLQPQRIHYWPTQQAQPQGPQASFHYKADALVGLALLQMNPHLQQPSGGNWSREFWLGLEPHYELRNRCQLRLQSLQKFMTPIKTSLANDLQNFETVISECLSKANFKDGLNLQPLQGIVAACDQLEKQMQKPLLYNFNWQLSKPLSQSLQCLHSLLFNLRALIAMHHNVDVEDATFEAVKVDSITDYFAKPEYISNDAILYWQFKNLANSMQAESAKVMNQAFTQYSYNATCLIDSLPAKFLQNISANSLDDTLYTTQMDWLLGTDAGLMFRIREELYALSDGYEKIFWQDLDGKPQRNHAPLSISCEVKERDLYRTEAA